MTCVCPGSRHPEWRCGNPAVSPAALWLSWWMPPHFLSKLDLLTAHDPRVWKQIGTALKNVHKYSKTLILSSCGDHLNWHILGSVKHGKHCSYVHMAETIQKCVKSKKMQNAGMLSLCCICIMTHTRHNTHDSWPTDVLKLDLFSLAKTKFCNKIFS